MKKYIIIITLCLLGALLPAQDVQLRYTITSGVHDTVSVYAQSNSTATLDMGAITLSVLSTQGAQVVGTSSILSQQWGGFAALTKETTSVGKTYKGIAYDGLWQFAIASVNNTAISIPAINTAEVLILKVWFTGASAAEYYLEDKAESLDMNEIESAGFAEITFEVVPPNTNNLPVELTSFTAEALDRTVMLEWVTELEINNAGFEVERSLTARNFSNVGYVEGAGTTSAPTEYQLVDADVVLGETYYYRLKQIDNDGQFSYSSIVEVSFDTEKLGAVSQLYPNPADQTTHVTLKVQDGGNIQWDVINVSGQSVKTGVVSMQGGETKEFEVNVSDLVKGIYVVKFSKEKAWTLTRKLIVR